MDGDRLLTRPELVQFCPEAALPIANRVALNQDTKTAAIVQAATLRAVGEWIVAHPALPGSTEGTVVVELSTIVIEAFRAGQWPAGWKE